MAASGLRSTFSSPSSITFIADHHKRLVARGALERKDCKAGGGAGLPLELYHNDTGRVLAQFLRGMGAYLSAPVTEKENEEAENALYNYAACAMQGWRTDMEDAHLAVLDLHGGSTDHPTTALFGVFDGHGGKEVALFAAAHLASELVATEGYKKGDLGAALVQAFLRIDDILLLPEHRAELKSMRHIEDGDKGEKNSGMTINSSQLPESLLEALGMPGERGYVLKFVKAPNGRMQIDDIMEGEGEEEEEEAAAREEVEDAAVDAAGAGASTDGEAVGAAAASGEGSSSQANGGPFAAAAAGAFPIEEDGAQGEGEGKAGGSSAKRKRAEAGAMQLDDDAAAEEDEDAGPAEVTALLPEDDTSGPTSGCTAVCALVRGTRLVVANAGDSRCVLSRRGTAFAMTQDHKPTDQEEYARIITAGGFVADGRVNGSLNLSRALGDLEYKQAHKLPPEMQAVTAFPEVREATLEAGDEFLILACDGIWDVLTNQEAVDFVGDRLAAGRSPREVCEDACDRCLAPDTAGCGKGCDNMTFTLVLLKAFMDPEEVRTARSKARSAGGPATQG